MTQPLRIPLTAKILLIAALNVVALAVAALMVARVELGGDFESLLLTAAREKIFAVSREFALELSETEPADRDTLTARYAATYGVHVLLFINDGTQLTGLDQVVPTAVIRQVALHPEDGMPAGAGRGRGRAPGAGFGRGPERTPESAALPALPASPPFLIVVDQPLKYWIGVRVPVRQRGDPQTLPGTLLFASSSLLGNPFYFQPLPWLGVMFATLAVTALCWLPFVRGMRQSVSGMTHAAGEIAEGRFDVPMDVSRRDELGTLARAIGRMSARLKTLVTGQKRFLGDAAHELRSPLARIALVTGLLERSPDETVLAYIDDLREDVELMTQLTDDLLAFARAEHAPAPIAVRPTPLGPLAERAARTETSLRPATIRIDAGLSVLAEPALLYRAIANLVRNAVQHAGATSAISIAAVDEGEYISVVVADDGPGVPEQELPALFTPFHRVDAARDHRATGGTGLGLAIVRSVADAFGGSVACRNLTPRGFEVSLRLRAAPAIRPG